MQSQKDRKNTSVFFVAVALFLLFAALFASLYYKKGNKVGSLSELEKNAIESGTVEEGEGTETEEASGQYLVTSPICNLDVQLVLDASHSMNNREADGRRKIEWAREAAVAFVNTMSGIRSRTPSSQIKIGVSQYGQTGGGSASVVRSLTSDFNSVISSIQSVGYVGPDRGTCISCGLTRANDDLIGSSSVNVKKAEVVLSDGCGNRDRYGRTISVASARTQSTQVANNGRSNGITYFTVGYSTNTTSNCGTPQYDEQTLLEIAGDPSRHFYRPNVADWVNTFEELALDICQPSFQCDTKAAYTTTGVPIAPDSVLLPGTNFRYRINYSNASDFPASNAYVEDQLPAGVSFVSSSTGNCYMTEMSSSLVRCDVGNVDPNVSGFVEFNARVNTNAVRGSYLLNNAQAYPLSGAPACTFRLRVATPTPTFTPTPTPTFTPTPTPTFTPTPTPTRVLPSPTVTFTPTPTPAPGSFEYKFRLFSESGPRARFRYWLTTTGINPTNFVSGLYAYRWDNVVPPSVGVAGYSRRITLTNVSVARTPYDTLDSGLTNGTRYYYKFCAQQFAPVSQLVCTPHASMVAGQVSGTPIATYTLVVNY